MARFKDGKFSDLKRRAILDAAMAEFEEKGPEKASMRAIASAAGMTTGAIYTMFDGKEDLYAALLQESLERLEGFVAGQVAGTDTPEGAVRAAVMGFFAYYQDRPFEVHLGMYSFTGFKQTSLGRERDERLNAALFATLDIIGRSMAEAAPHLPPERITEERNAILSCLFGALMLALSGRARSIGTTSDAVMETHVTSLLERLRKP